MAKATKKQRQLDPAKADMVIKLAMLQFSQDEIEALLADTPTGEDDCFVRGILEGQKVIRLALMNNASAGDTAAATTFLRLLAKS